VNTDRTMAVVPAPGSPMFESAGTGLQQYWRTLAAETCCYCEKPLDPPTWYIKWKHDAAHVACHEESLADWDKVRANPWLREDAAKRAGMTLEGFDHLHIWESDRLLREELEHRAAEKTSCPDSSPTDP
jgi:hypothetical protein